MLNVGHKSVTVGLFALTLYGGYVCTSGAKHIISRKMARDAGEEVPPLTPEVVQVDVTAAKK